ncbi:MAG: DUF421 domain-containing protein [Oscillospiraceae bacterium]|nr:DUF421 domain-containing protein [Oscillospiraceae bacterium]
MFISYLRSAILFFVLVLSVRLMGKRQIGEMEPSEFVITMLLANLASVAVQDSAIPLISGLVPILTVLALELILAYLSLRSIRIRQLFCGHPIILIRNGTVCQENLCSTRITMDELVEHLRENDIMDLSTIKYAILETNGQISTFLYGKDQPPTARDCGIQVKDANLPYTIISDGRILKNNLLVAGRDLAWLREQLKKAGCEAGEVFFLTVDETGKQILIRKEPKA